MAKIIYEGPSGIQEYEGDFYHGGKAGVMDDFVAIHDDESDRMNEKHIPLHRIYHISTSEATDLDIPSLVGEHH